MTVVQWYRSLKNIPWFAPALCSTPVYLYSRSLPRKSRNIYVFSLWYTIASHSIVGLLYRTSTNTWPPRPPYHILVLLLCICGDPAPTSVDVIKVCPPAFFSLPLYNPKRAGNHRNCPGKDGSRLTAIADSELICQAKAWARLAHLIKSWMEVDREKSLIKQACQKYESTSENLESFSVCKLCHIDHTYMDLHH